MKVNLPMFVKMVKSSRDSSWTLNSCGSWIISQTICTSDSVRLEYFFPSFLTSWGLDPLAISFSSLYSDLECAPNRLACLLECSSDFFGESSSVSLETLFCMCLAASVSLPTSAPSSAYCPSNTRQLLTIRVAPALRGFMAELLEKILWSQFSLPTSIRSVCGSYCFFSP